MKPVLFRLHRGTLEDAMKTVKEVSSAKDIEKILLEQGLKRGKIKIKQYVFDARINWDTHIVTLNGAAVGFTNGPIT
jgi:hypothetical protein